MRARRLTFLVAILAMALLPAGALAQTEGSSVHIRGVDERGFPTVNLTISVAGPGSLSLADVGITENGVPVRPASLRPLRQTGRDIDIVLALDTSNSVAGQPLETAVAAAKAFIDQLLPGISVGILKFAATPSVVQPITADHPKALSSLNSLTTSAGTSLYDAVTNAAGLFTGRGQHNVVVLTDGRDNKSKGSLDSAVAAAKASGVTVFSIGLGSAVDEKVLQTLATSTGGTYSSATDASLKEIYQRLSSELSNQYVVTYRSASLAGAQVSIAVSVNGAVDTALAVTPQAEPAVSRPSRLPTLHGTAGLALALGLSFLTLFLLFVMILGANVRAARQRELSRRMMVQEQRYEDRAAALDRSPSGLASWIPEPMVQAAERIASAGGFSGSLERRLEQAGLPLRVGEFLAASVLAALLGIVLGGLLLGSFMFALVLGVVGATVPTVLVSLAIGRRTTKLQGQLADVVTILASSLRAGHSFFQALDMASKEIGDPAGPEFQRVVAEIRLGRPVDEALNAMGERVGSDDFKWAVLAVNIQREVGGNLAEILDTVAETVRERGTLRRQVRVLSAEGRLSVKILVALPFLIGLYIAKVNPSYMNLLFTTRIGWIMLGTGAALLVAGVLWAMKIVRIDV